MNRTEKQCLDKIRGNCWETDKNYENTIIANEDIQWLIHEYDKLQKWVDTIKELIKLT